MWNILQRLQISFKFTWNISTVLRINVPAVEVSRMWSTRLHGFVKCSGNMRGIDKTDIRSFSHLHLKQKPFLVCQIVKKLSTASVVQNFHCIFYATINIQVVLLIWYSKYFALIVWWQVKCVRIGARWLLRGFLSIECKSATTIYKYRKRYIFSAIAKTVCNFVNQRKITQNNFWNAMLPFPFFVFISPPGHPGTFFHIGTPVGCL